jgi:hypothetical protein
MSRPKLTGTRGVNSLVLPRHFPGLWLIERWDRVRRQWRLITNVTRGVLVRLSTMEWATVTRAKPQHSEDPSDLELLEERWRVVGPSRRVVTCAIYRPTGPGVEVRAGYTVDHFHCTRRVAAGCR